MDVAIGIAGLVGVPLLIWALIKLRIIETPKQSLERQMEEANDEAREIAKYRQLSPEGQLLYDLNKKQENIEYYARGIYWMILGSAIGTLILYFFTLLAFK
ncbi:hypothetical protein [Gimesia aquarii]|uniref:Uncharacterized protein n=1 Tax=Gimesia aquarii TaxID=2527964 RepID=A0A517WNJ9_9PLAN|nr:hypothetical protein [Gimesia aquarii]QDU06834.1 hypothetical protein V202x_01770 [Gimesia aquarii]